MGILLIVAVGIIAFGFFWALFVARYKAGDMHENDGEFRAAIIVLCFGLGLLGIDLLWYVFTHLKISWG